MDVLNEIFDTLALRGVLYFRTHFSPPWAVAVPDLGQSARFHLVVQGCCHIRFPSGARVELRPGDLILIPNGRSHVLSDGTERSTPPLETVMERAGYRGDGVFVLGNGDPAASTQMVCGHFSFRGGADHPLLRAMPEYLVTTAEIRARQPWLDEILRLITQRVFSGEACSEAAVTRLSEIIFIELLRYGIGRNERLRSVLQAYQDPHLGRALHLIHSRPDHPWTVEKLASEACLSRSRFSERFSNLLGTGPMTYLTDWRLQKALSLLDDTRHSVKQVASRTGYRSPAAFSRAFTVKYGVSPREYRRSPGMPGYASS